MRRPPPAPAAALARALAALVAHHDALRLRFRRAAGRLAAAAPRRAPEAPPAPASAREVDLVGASPAGTRAGGARRRRRGRPGEPRPRAPGRSSARALARPARRARRPAAPRRPPPGRRRRLLAHPARGPGDGLRASSAAASRLALPPKTTSFAALGRAARRAGAPPRRRARARLLAGAAAPRAALPRAAPMRRSRAADRAPTPRTRWRRRQRRRRARRGETADLLRALPAAYGAPIDDVLLAALAATLAGRLARLAPLLRRPRGARPRGGRRDRGGSRPLAHRRLVHQPLPGAPRVPRRRPAPGGGPRAPSRSQLRAVPGRGLGYGLLRYLRRAAGGGGPRRRAAPPRSASTTSASSTRCSPPARRSPPPASRSGPSQSPRAAPQPPARGQRQRRRRAPAGDLDLRRRAALAGTVERRAPGFAERLAALVAHCRARRRPAPRRPDAVGLPARRASASAELDRLPVRPAARRRGRLSARAAAGGDALPQPLRAGLGASTSSSSAPTFAGELDVAAFARRLAAGRRAPRRSSAPRFAWRRACARPLQVVRRRVELPGSSRRTGAGSRSPSGRRRFARAGCAPTAAAASTSARPPLLRWTLVRTGERAWRFLWSHHHLLLDGWSFAALIGDFAACYEALAAGREPVAPRRGRPTATTSPGCRAATRRRTTTSAPTWPARRRSAGFDRARRPLGRGPPGGRRRGAPTAARGRAAPRRGGDRGAAGRRARAAG